MPLSVVSFYYFYPIALLYIQKNLHPWRNLSISPFKNSFPIALLWFLGRQMDFNLFLFNVNYSYQFFLNKNNIFNKDYMHLRNINQWISIDKCGIEPSTSKIELQCFSIRFIILKLMVRSHTCQLEFIDSLFLK